MRRFLCQYLKKRDCKDHQMIKPRWWGGQITLKVTGEMHTNKISLCFDYDMESRARVLRRGLTKEFGTHGIIRIWSTRSRRLFGSCSTGLLSDGFHSTAVSYGASVSPIHWSKVVQVSSWENHRICGYSGDVSSGKVNPKGKRSNPTISVVPLEHQLRAWGVWAGHVCLWDSLFFVLCHLCTSRNSEALIFRTVR